MRHYLPILIFFSLFINCKKSECPLPKCNNDYNLKGGVHEVEENVAFPAQDAYPISYKTKILYTFNQNDYTLSVEEMDREGHFYKKEFQYDNDNIIKEITETAKGKVVSKSSIVKNKNNRIEKITVDKENENSETIILYDHSPCLSNRGEEFKNGKLVQSWEIEYKNDLAAVITTTQAGIKKQAFYTYNSNNDIIEVVEKDKDGKTLNIQTSVYKYDPKNNWIEKNIYNTNKTLIISITRKIKYW